MDQASHPARVSPRRAGPAPERSATVSGGAPDTATPSPRPVIEMDNINKRFGDVQANAGVHLQIAAGEIHCLLGENGAGKSTLMKVLYGLYPMDSGEIRVRGHQVVIRNPADAMAVGIGMVH